MARGDGVNRTNVRNVRLTTPKLSNAQQHMNAKRNHTSIRTSFLIGHI